MTEKLPFDPAKEPYINLMTYRKSGVEVKTPVWVAKSGDMYYIFSESKAGKVKRLRNNNQIRIAACDVRGKVKSDWLEGTAHIIDNPESISAMYQAFDKKYKWQMRALNFMARLSGRYNKRAILAFSLNQQQTT